MGLNNRKVYVATPCRLADGYHVSEEPAVCIVRVSATLLPRRHGQHVSHKTWYPSTRPHGMTVRMITTSILTTVTASNLIQLKRFVYKMDKERNRCIRGKTGAQNIVKEIKQYQEKWLQQVQGMDTNRIPKQALQYEPKGRRNIVRPRKRWRDQLNLEDQETGNTPNTS